jgi:curved DNA-binding protein
MNLDFMTAAKGGEREIVYEGGKVKVKIPRGIGDGQKIRLKGKGLQGSGAGQPGDLLIKINLEPHPYFSREGNDLFVEIPITVAESVLGGKISVPTLEGTATMTVPPSTQSGQKLRLRGKGIQSSGETGDLYVIIKIVPPKKMDESARDLMKKFSEATKYDPRKDLF